MSNGFYNTVPRGYGGLVLGGGRLNGLDKMNGLGGPKHKRGDNERECTSLYQRFNQFCVLNVSFLQGIGLQALALRIYKETSRPCAKISMVAAIYRRSLKKAWLSTEI